MRNKPNEKSRDFPLTQLIPKKLRRYRRALMAGLSVNKACGFTLGISTRSVRNYLHRPDEHRKLVVERITREGEALRGEPLAELLCYLLDKRDDLRREWLVLQERCTDCEIVNVVEDGIAYQVKYFTEKDPSDIHFSIHTRWLKVRLKLVKLERDLRREIKRNEEIKAHYGIVLNKPEDKTIEVLFRRYWDGIPKELIPSTSSTVSPESEIVQGPESKMP